MKKKYLWINMLIVSIASGQESSKYDTIKSHILAEIETSLNYETVRIDNNLMRLNNKLDSLDNALRRARNVNDKANNLFERVQALEEKQAAHEASELNVYQANYQSATINLVSMEMEIKPLVLFNSTKDFFDTLGDASNPMKYDGYDIWYKEFKLYVDQQKKKQAKINVLSGLLTLTGDFTKNSPISGPLIEPLFSGITSFINNIPNRKQALIEESEKMFLLTSKIAQFTHDKDLIAAEWGSITKQLDELQKHYDKILSRNLGLLSEEYKIFVKDFASENNANNRYDYLTKLKLKAGDFVKTQKESNSKDWKDITYVQLMEIQSLKLRFGQITFNISENISKYKQLIDQYKSDEQIGFRIKDLELKLINLQNTFDKAFQPIEYINSTNRMYKIN